jgi:predicted anti-sigma-YlaC factor YlaD
MMINCDQAFDAMTSRENELYTELREHLEQCPRCREMAEILSPVLGELLSARIILESEREFANPSETTGVQVARRAARDLRYRTQSDSRLRSGSSLLKSKAVLTALMLLIGVGGGWGLSLLHSDIFAPRNMAAATSKAENCTWKEQELAASREPSMIISTCIACHPMGSPR